MNPLQSIAIDTEVRFVTMDKRGAPEIPPVQLVHSMRVGDSRTPWMPISLTIREAEWLIGALQTAVSKAKEAGRT